MPTYDYVCEACDHRFERYQEMSDKKLRTCPKCGKRRLARLVGAGAGLIFKGSGFYITDYPKTPAPPREGDTKPATAPKEGREGKEGKEGREGKEGKEATSPPSEKSAAPGKPEPKKPEPKKSEPKRKGEGS